MQVAKQQIYLIGLDVMTAPQRATLARRYEGLKYFDDAAQFTAWIDYARMPSRACIVMPLRHAPLSGIDLLDILRADHVATPVVLITGANELIDAVRTTRYDGVHTLWPPFEIQRVIDTVDRALLESDRRRAEHDADPTSLEERIASLSLRQRQVLHCVFAGAANRSIASDLGISVKTVELHRACMMKKMQADSVIELIRMLAEIGKPMQSA